MNYVELDDCVDEQSPYSAAVAKATERGVPADTDGGAGAVWETICRVRLVGIMREREGTYARLLRSYILVAKFPNRTPPPTLAMFELSNVTSWNSTRSIIMVPARPYAP